MNGVATAADAGRAARATAMLVVVTLLWGLSFAWMKNWQEAARGAPGGPLLSGLTLIALRMPLAILVLAAWQPRLFTAATRREYAAGALIAVPFTGGFVLQVWGLNWTTPALSAFVTSLCSAWAPLLAWACLGVAVGRLNLLGLAVALAGTAVLGLRLDEGWALGPGEALTLLASLLFALELLLLDRLGRAVNSAHLTAGFLGTAAVLAGLAATAVAARGPGLAGWAAWVSDMLGRPPVLRDLALMTLLPTVLAFHWMNVYQPRVPVGRAALIYLLEPVFSSAFSVWWKHDQVTETLLLGGGLVLAGNLLVELPRWLGGAGTPGSKPTPGSKTRPGL
ncbi:MAG TPA: DMT family transporter [Gemmataceae bacterium]|jgi:drug/metabolite transporter (DMT)-like permease|nr:DMT family transporter [Gemmataceae bacterium]